MAEVSENDLLKPGHHFGTGPYLLDLYRLLCMVLADLPLAEMEEHAITIHRLRGEFVYPELIRASSRPQPQFSAFCLTTMNESLPRYV
jgi:hypothetical protein